MSRTKRRIVLIWTTLLILSSSEGLAAQPDSVEVIYRTGLDYLERRALNRAAGAFRRCLEIEPKHYGAALYLGRVYGLKGEWDLAVEQLRRAVKVASNRVEAHMDLAKALRAQWKLREASGELRQVVQIEPENISAYAMLGSILMLPASAMDVEGAKEAFERILTLDPENEWAKSHLMLAELNLGHFSEAAEDCKALIEHHPKDYKVRYALGIARLYQEDLTGAIAALKQAIELWPEGLGAKWNLRLAYAQRGGYPEDLDEKYRIEIAQENSSETDVRFVDVGGQVGVAKTDMGRGCAWGDYDNDGDLDLLAVGARAPLALYRNNGDYTFTDVAWGAGVDDARGAFGSIFADYDNDGDIDIYVIRNGWFGGAPNTLYRNNGDGTFADVTEAAGVGDMGSGICAVFGDYDNDGYLDLFVANGIAREGSPNVLYRNNGDGTFTDVAHEAGVDHRGRAIGTAFGDYDNDGYLDLYVVNFDGRNLLYHNNGDGTFTDVAQKAGVALPLNGYVTFFFDYNNDGYLDLFVSQMSSFRATIQSRMRGKAPDPRDRLTLYRNNRDGTFTDVTYEAGLGKSFQAMGAGFGDIDNDGYLDIYLANGGTELDQREPDVLFHNNGDGTFSDITKQAGLGNLGKTKGVAFGDYDGDGDLDIYASIGGVYPGDAQPNSLYRNEGNKNWLVVKLVGTKSNRDGIGAKVKVVTGSFARYAEVSGGFGFGAMNSLPLEFGLGSHTKVDLVEVRWPSGIVDKIEGVAANQVLTVREGTSR